MPKYTDVEIVDFHATPNKASYVLSAGGKGFFVINEDPNKLDSENNSKERRVTLGSIPVFESTYAEGGNVLDPSFDKKKGVPFKGLMYLGPDELFEVKGMFKRNRNGYTAIQAPTNIGTTEMHKLFDNNPLLEQLEHYMVPEIMAKDIREYKSTGKRAPKEQLLRLGISNYRNIRILNLQKRPDRMVYKLTDANEQSKPEFIIINNDSDMDKSWQMRRNWKSGVDSIRTRRHITVAKLIDKGGEKNMNLCEGLKGSGILFKGLAYPTSLFLNDDGDFLTRKIIEEIGKEEFEKQYPELYVGAGRISDDYCYKSESARNTAYTTVNEMLIDENPADATKLLTPALLQQLERFTVPREMASKIRKIASSSKI